MAYLLVMDAAGETWQKKLSQPVTTVGSGADCDVILPHQDVPEFAAQILATDGNYVISTVDRKTPISANGRKRKKHTLKPGDSIKIGEALFIYHDGDPPNRRTTTTSPTAVMDAYTSLHRFSVELMATRDVPTLFESVIDEVISLTAADMGFLLITKDDGYTVAVARNFKGHNIDQAIEELSDSIVRRVVNEKVPVLVSDAQEESDYANAVSVMRLQLTSAMCAPLLHQGKLLGAIYVGSKRPLALFDSGTLDVLTIFSAQASLILASAMAYNELKSHSESLESQLDQSRMGQIIGACPAMQSLYTQVKKVAKAQVSVLVTGETGTGKELIAKELHRLSPRAAKPFVSVNCGAIPETLMEAELFGHVKGAFTGASASRNGKFAEAHLGTLFLDEIGEMPASLQVKMLRALQEQTIRPLGSEKDVKVDIRVIAATHRDLAKDVETGRFREDLFYRLNVIKLDVPALRDRGSDVVLLAKYFLQKNISSHHSHNFTPQATRALRRHEWPGNVRELENRIHKACILSDGPTIDATDLGLDESTLPAILPLNHAKEKFQLQYIEEVLAIVDGNRTKAAELLGVDPRTIFRYLKKKGSAHA